MAMQIVFPGPLTSVDTDARVPLGTRAEDVNGNEYVYLTGVAATIAGNWVSYSGTYTTARTTAASRGHLAIAQAPVLAGQFGWYLVSGRGTADVLTATAADSRLFLTGTAGRVDGTLAANTLIANAESDTLSAANSASVTVHYPFAAGANALPV